jgi:hypothetical protein
MFGMTFSQMMILGCLALAAIGTIFGSFILISTSTTPGGSPILPATEGTIPIQPTDPLPFPGGQDVVLTATLSVLGEGIPSDWKLYSATTFALSVLPQFEAVSNPDQERQDRIATYRNQGYEFLAVRLENDSFDYRFWFNYPQTGTIPYNSHIIVRADVLPTYTLDEYVDQVYGAGVQGFQVADRQEFDIENLQARRVLLDASLNEQAIRVVEYIITDEVNLWIISCGSIREEFDTWLPIFDRVASSFHLLY